MERGRVELPQNATVRRNCARLSESEKAQDRAIILPLFHQMTDADQDKVSPLCRKHAELAAIKRR